MRRSPALLACCLALSGCSTSIWQASYRPSPLAGPAAVEPAATARTRPAPSQILVREAPWARLETALRELEDEEAASELHISEWPEDKRLAAVARLLSALQLQDDPASVEILGWSSFASTTPIRPEAGVLDQARRLGADTAIWSSRVIGVGARVIDRPVRVHHHGWGHYYDRDDGAWRSAWSDHVDTAWVPVVVEADRVAYVAFYLRRAPGR
jgi:hypothetical protein